MTWLSLSWRSTSGGWWEPLSRSLYSQTLTENRDFPYGGDPVYRVSLLDKNVAVPSPRVQFTTVTAHLRNRTIYYHYCSLKNRTVYYHYCTSNKPHSLFTTIISHLTNRTVYLLPLFHILQTAQLLPLLHINFPHKIIILNLTNHIYCTIIIHLTNSTVYYDDCTSYKPHSLLTPLLSHKQRSSLTSMRILQTAQFTTIYKANSTVSYQS